MNNYIVISDDEHFDLNLIKNINLKNNDLKLSAFIASTPNLDLIKKSLYCDIFFWKDLIFNFENILKETVVLDNSIYEKFLNCEQIHNKMLDFLSPTGHEFSLIELRKNYVITLEFCLSLIKNYKPELVFFTNIPHSYHTAVLYEVCKILNIPTIVMRETLPGIYIYEKIEENKTEVYFGNKKKIENSYLIKKKILKNFLSENHSNFFTKLRNHKLTKSKFYNLKPYFIILIIFFIERIFILIKDIIKNLIKSIIFKFNHFFKLGHKLKFQNPLNLPESWKIFHKDLEKSTNSELYIAKKLFHEDIKKFNIYNNYKKNICSPKLNQKFVYFPLHFQPEATTYPYGNFYIDQINAIKMLSNFIDNETKIYIKEHPDTFNLSRTAWYRGLFSRDKKFYSDILKLNKTFFIDINYNSNELIDNCLFVSTITGTSALQASLRNKNSVVFGNCWFKNCEGIYSINHNNTLIKFIEEKRYNRQIDRAKLEGFFQYFDANSFETSKSNILKIDDNFNLIADNFLSEVNELIY